MGQLTYDLVIYIIQTFFMTILCFIIAFPLLWILGRKRQAFLRVFAINLFATLGYLVTHWGYFYVGFSWVFQFDMLWAIILQFILPPIMFFVVYLISTLKLVKISSLGAVVAAIILTILSYFLYWTSSFMIYPLVPYLWVIKSWPTP